MLNSNEKTNEPGKSRSTSGETKRILIADSNTLFRNALIVVLNGSGEENDVREFEIVQSVSNGAEVVKAVAGDSFDLILMDPEMPGMNGYEAARTILLQHPEQKILVFTMRKSETNLRKSLEIGVYGHLSKDCSIDDLQVAIKTVLAGKKFFDSDQMLKLIGADNNKKNTNILTEHELVLLKLVFEEKTTAQMARFVGLAVRTVEKQLLVLFSKTRTKSKTGLAIYAIRNGLA